MNDVVTPAPAKDRPIATAITHASPLGFVFLAPVNLALTVIPRGSTADHIAITLFSAVVFVLLFAGLLHQPRPCYRCVRISERDGKAGAHKRRIFLAVYHVKKPIMVTVIVAMVVGFGLTLLLGFTGHAQHALWPMQIGFDVAYLLWGLTMYGILSHFAFGSWCPIGEPHPAWKAE